MRSNLPSTCNIYSVSLPHGQLAQQLLPRLVTIALVPLDALVDGFCKPLVCPQPRIQDTQWPKILRETCEGGAFQAS